MIGQPGYCCACTSSCGHTGPHSYCAQHAGSYNHDQPQGSPACNAHFACEVQIAQLGQNLARGFEDAFRDRDCWIKRAEDADAQLAATRTALSELLERYIEDSPSADFVESLQEVIAARAALTGGVAAKTDGSK